MIRRIIRIDQEKCNGCGACVDACHEGAIGMRNGKAVLLRDDYCDGLGDCLPACPTDAISFEEREALPYDEAAVLANIQGKQKGGCPGSMARELFAPAAPMEGKEAAGSARPSALRQWPVQIKLVPVEAPWLNGADLLVAADCVAFAHGDFHREFMRGKVTLIGCPKLDSGDYAEKLAEILKRNNVRSLTVARMSVPCCGALAKAAQEALAASGKTDITFSVAVIAPDGSVAATGTPWAVSSK